jgi:hypothetical protein
MDIVEIVMKLVGPIDPVGETNADNKRLENLRALCDTVAELADKIDDVRFLNAVAFEYSRKEAAKLAEKSLKDLHAYIGSQLNIDSLA